MTTTFITIEARSMDDACREITLKEYVDYMWKLRRIEQQRRNAWNLINWCVKANAGIYRARKPEKRTLWERVRGWL